jgi:hypothetical protein
MRRSEHGRLDLGRRRLRGRDGDGERVNVHAVGSRRAAQQLERLLEIDPESLSEHTFRLLDHDPRGQGMPKLLVLALEKLEARDSI